MTRLAERFLTDRRTLWSVLGLTLVLWLCGNLPWQLDDYDQAKQAYTSFELVKAHHWFYQHTPNEKVATKPPLVGWISAALYGLTGSWALAWRLPSLLAAAALIALLGHAVARTQNGIAALIAMSAFGLNLLSLRIATLVRTDMPLALVVFLLGWQIWQKVRLAEPWRDADRWIAFLLLTAAMLIKGPIVYAFLLPGIVVMEWRRRHDRGRGRAFCGWGPWLASLGVFLVWVIGGMLFVRGFFDQVVLREFLGRFGETVHKPQAIYFYLPHLLHKFAPWSILLIALAILLRGTAEKRWRDRWQNLSPEILWVVAWSMGGLLVLSLIPSKRVDRMFPIVPPLALLLGVMVGRCLTSSRWRGAALRWSALALVTAVLVSVGYTAVKLDAAYRDRRGALVDFGESVRAEASLHHWRYAVMGRDEEGLLLYLDQLHFQDHADVVEQWENGEIDAVVAPAAEEPLLLRDLPGAIPSRLQSRKPGDDRTPPYIFLTRS